MKRLFCVLIILIFIMPLSVSSGIIPKYKFAIYLVKDLSSAQALKLPLEKLPLEYRPFITEKDISVYYWRSNTLLVDDSFINKFNKLYGSRGVPFVLIVDGERIYSGAFSPILSSVAPPKELAVIHLTNRWGAMEELYKYGYQAPNSMYLQISAPRNVGDNRNDERIYAALKSIGILKE